MLTTILSRCQRFDLRRIPSALIVSHLAQIARLENVSVEAPALHAIARGADGGMRDAESALDQLISFCGGRIVETDVLSMFGLAARSQVTALAGAVLAGQPKAALHELDELSRNGKDLGRLLADLTGHFRDLLLFQVSEGDRTVLDVSDAEWAALSAQATHVTTDGLTRILDLLTEHEGRLRDAASKRILVEVALLKSIQARSALSIDEVLRKLQTLRDQAGGNTPAPAPSNASAPVVETRTTPEPAPVSSSLPQPVESAPTTSSMTSAPAAGKAQDLTELWGRMVEAAGRVSPFARTYLLEAHPVSFVRNVFTIGFDPEFADHLGLVDNSRNRTLLQTKLQELGFPNAQVKFVQADAPAGWMPKMEAPSAVPPPAPPVSTAAQPVASKPEAPAPPAESPEDFKNDPLIRKALEIFKGQIVEVRA